MERLVEILLINSAAATVIALVAVAAGRAVIRRPAVLHVLWLAVLLKLLAPPVLETALLPAWMSPFAAPEPAPAVTAPLDAERLEMLLALAALDDVALPQPGLDRSEIAARVAGGLWLAGTLLVLLLGVTRSLRFRRLVADAPPAPAPLMARARSIAADMGLGPVPRLRLVQGRVPPMLWPRLGPPEVLLPGTLFASLAPAEQDALIAHELAHFSRKDHWVRYLEMLAVALFWWHPVTWWARRRLRAAEERCCDDLVVETLPGRGRAYAQGLLKTVEFLSGRGPTVPAVATGAGESRHLEERLTMIMNPSRRGRLSGLQRWLLAIGAIGALAFFPTWSERAPESSDEAGAETLLGPRVERTTPGDNEMFFGPDVAWATAPDRETYFGPGVSLAPGATDEDSAEMARLREQLRELEAREAELRARMRELESERHAIGAERHRLESEGRHEELMSLYEEARANGRDDEARKLLQAAEALERERDLSQERHAIEAELLAREADLERAARELALEAREPEGGGQQEAARERLLELRELQARQELDRREAGDRLATLELQRAEAEYERALARASELDARGRQAEAEEHYERALRLAKEMQAADDRSRDDQRHAMKELEVALRDTYRRYEDAAAAGDEDAMQALKHRMHDAQLELEALYGRERVRGDRDFVVTRLDALRSELEMTSDPDTRESLELELLKLEKMLAEIDAASENGHLR